ncbi:hypothetical protein Dimus_024686, partial [Dionaea muscipula]
MMQTVTTQVAQHLCSSVSFHLKQINPLIDIDPAVLMRLVTTTPSPGDASSAPNHQSSVGLNRDSSIGTNKTHSEDILESFQGTEFFYMEQAGNRSLYSSLSFRNKVVQRQDEKWWLPVPCLPK